MQTHSNSVDCPFEIHVNNAQIWRDWFAVLVDFILHEESLWRDPSVRKYMVYFPVLALSQLKQSQKIIPYCDIGLTEGDILVLDGNGVQIPCNDEGPNIQEQFGRL